ncbi:mycothiol synthase [Streptantibioticus silvisoli]|uniref:Mycothiol acetyltransferase n=1 Tax=Streptantibioticus silvisoli TaxID=2705255 RepID=A0ABT6W110_9ACTN|nr:mycothiol synthase [Streptantibioticus silvisoli]MDI5963632.1 mycothiol synthase [Streptantibioticus silvisoli]
MTDPTRDATGRRIETAEEVPPGTVTDVLALLERAAAADGQAAVSEQGRLNLRAGRRDGVRHVLVHGGKDGEQLIAYGQLEDSDPVEAPTAELVVDPGCRSRGHGRALARALLEVSGSRLRAWAHGGHPAARHLATRLGLALFRELRQMRRPLPGDGLPEPVVPPGVTIRTFRPGQDDGAWLAVNAAAFAHHPEQGSLTQRDLDDRMAEVWFDPAGFFLAERDGRLAGFHWTKVHQADRLGEVYVVGVHPDEQGSGLGKALTAIGLRHLAGDRGLPTAMLYVDADNTPAVSVYERLGFTTHEVDLMYRTEG